MHLKQKNEIHIFKKRFPDFYRIYNIEGNFIGQTAAKPVKKGEVS